MVPSSPGPVAGISAGTFAIGTAFTGVSAGGTTFAPNTSTTISWSYPTGYNGNVDLLWSSDGGNTFQAITPTGGIPMNNGGNTGSYAWTVPTLL